MFRYVFCIYSWNQRKNSLKKYPTSAIKQTVICCELLLPAIFFYIWSFLPERMITGQILTLNFYLILENRLVKPLTKLYMRYSFRLLSRIAWNIQLSWVWDVSGVGCFSNWRCIQFKVIDIKQLRNTMKWFTKNKKDINYQRTIKYFTAFKQHVHVL